MCTAGNVLTCAFRGNGKAYSVRKIEIQLNNWSKFPSSGLAYVNYVLSERGGGSESGLKQGTRCMDRPFNYVIESIQKRC